MNIVFGFFFSQSPKWIKSVVYRIHHESTQYIRLLSQPLTGANEKNVIVHFLTNCADTSIVCWQSGRQCLLVVRFSITTTKVRGKQTALGAQHRHTSIPIWLFAREFHMSHGKYDNFWISLDFGRPIFETRLALSPHFRMHQIRFKNRKTICFTNATRLKREQRLT